MSKLKVMYWSYLMLFQIVDFLVLITLQDIFAYFINSLDILPLKITRYSSNKQRNDIPGQSSIFYIKKHFNTSFTNG